MEETVMPLSAEDMTEIVSVRFKETGKVYYFSPGPLQLKVGDTVIVETSRGMEYGFVMVGNHKIPTEQVIPPLRTLIRAATPDDTERYETNKKLEREAFDICLEKIHNHGLDMKLIDAEYTFDNSKLLFYFSADVRVDFRELVKDLASVFRTRIELRQIGIRDEAKMLGGLGVCGRPFCCATFLSDFVQVAIKMAKEQNLSLNSSKISGTCGRLMCCLRYEHETYEEEIRRTPPVDSTVKTPDGIGTVAEISLLTGYIKVRLNQGEDIRVYHRDQVSRDLSKELPKDTATRENQTPPGRDVFTKNIAIETTDGDMQEPDGTETREPKYRDRQEHGGRERRGNNNNRRRN